MWLHTCQMANILLIFFTRELFFMLQKYIPKKKRKTMDLHRPKAQVDYIFKFKKLINSTLICESYSSFERLFSDHGIFSTKMGLSLHGNKNETAKTARYDWSSLTNRYIRNKYTMMIGMDGTSESWNTLLSRMMIGMDGMTEPGKSQLLTLMMGIDGVSESGNSLLLILTIRTDGTSESVNSLLNDGW